MDVGSVGSVLQQASVSMVKKGQDVERIEGEAAVKLIEGSGPAPSANPVPAPGQPGSTLSVYA
jgi:hypothetical protein